MFDKAKHIATFQFPPPRGGEPWTPTTQNTCEDFNSRPREGANVSPASRKRTTAPFQFPPREGANGEYGGVACVEEISIPAPVRGRTQGGDSPAGAVIFQFPPP